MTKKRKPVEIVPVSIDSLYSKRSELDKEMNKHPKRFYNFSNENGDFTSDLKAVPGKIQTVMRRQGATKEEIKEAVAIHNEHIAPIIKQKKLLTRAINGFVRVSTPEMDSGDEYILEREKDTLLKLFGSFHTVAEVLATLKEDLGYSVNQDSLSQWKKIHEEEIAVIRTNYSLENGRGENRVATEVGRLAVLNELLHLWQNKFREDGSKLASDMVMKILDSARKEVKGELITVQGGLSIDIRATIQASQNIRGVFSNIHINSMVIGVVAANQGIDPSGMIASLANSWYRKLNGFNGPVDDSEVEHPSAIIKTFDWGNIERIAREKKVKPELLENVYPNSTIANGQARSSAIMEALRVAQRMADE